MGQQQLLLLVLSTVIVGLATVAGIQAFSENQQQATQDALVQRAITLGNDLKASHDEPSQFGGITIGESNSNPGVAGALGLDDATDIPADGAGESAGCAIKASVNPAKVYCGSDGASSSEASGSVQVTVDVNPGDEDPVTVSSINVTS